ncbi:DUF47 family protein [Xinfangfangia sp. CPCC 101601]|uniref:DUF47 family protein n=1 Tax=Pseudogemmobacter lacusdianii TaxID=3069608 RepID=A0ABU0VYA5_9RHOB|nr:DUF47 family protein [Xinfangfangia sp. CPCC 101601]MDQ2066508.1 DUF47 family protein [Xinfangfangia sp. CPCC 101601]
MFSFIRALLPRSDNFFELFEAQAKKAQEAALTLRQVVEGGAETSARCAKLSAQEKEADLISYEVLESIRRSFITPFDRSDIKALSTTLDDAIDQMNKTGKKALLYNITSFEPNMREMADRVIALSNIVAEALPLMRNMSANAARLHELVAEISRIEEESDHLNDAGLREMFKAKQDGKPLDFVVGSQIYDHLEKCCDRFEDVAHVIGDIVIEHV